MMPNSFSYEETVKSAQSHRDEEFSPEWIEYGFTAWAQCSLSSCKQKFAISGDGGVSPEFDSSGDWEYEDVFYPKHCFPMPNIIELPFNCPPSVRDELRNAFTLFWSHHAACAGRIRVALEHLMNHLGIPKNRQNEERSIDLSLHARIDAFATKEPMVGRQLMALKWLGNTGSHDGAVSRGDLLDAFEILEHALSELLERRSERIAVLVKKMEEKHKPN